MPDISLVIPFLNEAENLNELIKQLEEYEATQPFSIEAVFVDDGSTDSSVEILHNAAFKHISAKLVGLSKNYGSHAAVRAGVANASGRYTMFFSADLQEPFSLIDRLYSEALEGDYDIVAARKAQTEVPFGERMFSLAYSGLVRKFAIPGYPIGNVNNMLFNEKVRIALCKNEESNSSIQMQIMNMGFRKTVIDTQILARRKGKSKWTLGKKIKLFIDSFVSFSFTPIRLISIVGILMFFMGLIYAAWIILAKIAWHEALSAGFPTIVCVLLLGFGVTNLALGIVAEYLWRTLDAARGRPVYIIDTVEELENSKGYNARLRESNLRVSYHRNFMEPEGSINDNTYTTTSKVSII